MKRTLCIALCIAFTGCAQMPVSPAGRHVKIVKEAPQGCEFVDSVTEVSGGRNDAEKFISVRTMVMNTAAKIGATHIVIVQGDVSVAGNDHVFGSRSMAADAYRCRMPAGGVATPLPSSDAAF